MGWNYGRKIIEALFAGRAKRTSVRAKFESRCEADRDRSDIRVFEVGLSAQQFGDYQQSTRIVAEKVAAQLVAIAKANGIRLLLLRYWNNILGTKYERRGDRGPFTMKSSVSPRLCV